MPKSMQSGHRATHARVCQARERIGDDGHAPVLPIPDVQGRMHNQAPSPRDQQRRPPRRLQAQKNGEEEDADAARSCWSRRRGRSGRRRWRRGGARRSEEGNLEFLAQGRMIRMTRRRRSKETAKNSYSLTKTMRGAHSDESMMRSGTWSTAVRKQRRRRPQGDATAA